MIKLCVFDLDGTILDTLPSISYFGNEALKKYGFSEVLYSKYRYFVGDGAKMLIKRMIEDVGGNEEDYNNVYNEYMQTYTKNSTYLTKIYDGIDTMLEKIKELDGKKIILGLPKNMDGSESFRVEKTRAFAEMLGKETELEIIFVDERLSTVQAYTYLNMADFNGKKRRGVIDALSAQIILQSYLDSNRK